MPLVAEDQMRQILRRIAVGVVHLLQGRALLSWPGSGKDHPSPQVVVNLTVSGPLDESYRALFPFQVRGPFWERVVVPVLRDLQASPEGPETRIDQVNEALLVKAREEGFLPTNTQLGEAVDLAVVILAAPGEPVNRTPEIPADETYQRFD